MTGLAADPPRSRRTPVWLLVLLWTAGILIALLVGIVLARRPLANVFCGFAAGAASKRDYPSALNYIRLSYLLAPSDLKFDILYLRYRYLENSGDLEGALHDLNAIVQIDPGWKGGSSYHARGSFFMRQSRWEEAIRDFEASLPHSPPRGFVDLRLGECHHGKGDVDAARRHYRAAAADPDPAWSGPARKALQGLP